MEPRAFCMRRNCGRPLVDFSDISLAERARRYRELANEARQTASNLPMGDLRSGWLKIASDWIELAEEIESALNDQRPENNEGRWLPFA